MRRRRVYVQQFGYWWSLTPEAWRRACELAVAGEPFNWDDLGRQLKRGLSKWDACHKPLDWDAERWADALAETKEMTS